MQNILFILLYPFSVLYDVVTRFRNHLYNIGNKPSVSFDLPVISVGNLTVGGTGKTPHIEWLIRLLKDNYQLATLSRGYGRKTSGFILADETATAQKIGDEPMQFYNKFRTEITVAVGEARALAIPHILIAQEATEAILLDDAYQHRKVKPSLNILLTDFNRPFYNDYLLPSGRLREARKGAQRADIIIVSKCSSDLSQTNRDLIEQNIRRYSHPNTPVFFSFIRYAKPISIWENANFNQDSEVILVTGISQPGPLKQYISHNFKLLQHIQLPDHADYTDTRIEEIKSAVKNKPNAVIITTEKDAVKLKNETRLKDLPIFEIKIEIAFLEKQSLIEGVIINHINAFNAI